MWWWRKVRRADISQEDRDRFERYGETVVALLLASMVAINSALIAMADSDCCR
jgi:hypothetical protein